MRALGYPVDDLSDDVVRVPARALVGDRPDALERIARTLDEADTDDDEPG